MPPFRLFAAAFALLAAMQIAAPSGALAQPDAAPAVSTAADFAVIMDYRTGEILFDKNGRTPTAPASMSKLMTVAIVFERLKNGSLSMSDTFKVSEKAWRKRGSKMWVRVDTEIALENLLRGVIVQSGNDACIVIAENISGSEEAFAELMNQKAREWGLKDSTFANATGWPDPNQKMSMRDLATLARKIIHDYPEYYALYSEREFTWEKIRQSNRNPLLASFDGADGLKTGHTEESGYGLVGSALKDGERRIVVVNGLASERERSTESARMMRIAFNDFTTRNFFRSGDVVADAEVFKGKDNVVPLVLDEPVNLIVHRSVINDVSATVVYEGPVAAPIRERQQIGFLKVEAPNGQPREYPLYAARAVDEKGFFGKVGLAARRLLAKPESGPEASAETGLSGN